MRLADFASIIVVASIVACTAEDDDPPPVDGVTSDASAATTTGASETSAATTNDPSSGATSPSTTTSPTSADASSNVTSDDDSSGDPPGATTDVAPPEGCYDYDAFEATTVGFRADVMPIFAAACSQCHSDPTASIYFGMGGTSEAEASAIHAKLLDGMPKQAPHLAFVAPGDPLHSYMLAKVEYPIPGGTCSEVQCDEPGCELPAPPSSPLSESDKAILRSWVIGGALDD